MSIEYRHTLREGIPIGLYLVNAMDMLRDWSMGFRNQDKKAEKPFYKASTFTKLSWTLTYNLLFKSGEALIQKSRDICIYARRR